MPEGPGWELCEKVLISVYVDDIAISSQPFGNHTHHRPKVLRQLGDPRICVNPTAPILPLPIFDGLVKKLNHRHCAEVQVPRRCFFFKGRKSEKKTHSLFIKGKENPRPLDREVNPSRPNRSWTVVSRKQQVTVTDWELGSRQMPGSWTVTRGRIAGP